MNPALATHLRNKILGDELTPIPRAGHFMMEAAPAEVVRALPDFFTPCR